MMWFAKYPFQLTPICTGSHSYLYPLIPCFKQWPDSNPNEDDEENTLNFLGFSSCPRRIWKYDYRGRNSLALIIWKMLFQQSPRSPQIPDYFSRGCQATVKDDKLTMAFFFVKIMSTSKHSDSIAKNMQCLQVLAQSVVLQTKRRSPMTPQSALKSWEIWNLLSHLSMYSHNFNSKSEVFNMSLVSQFIETWTGLRSSVANL